MLLAMRSASAMKACAAPTSLAMQRICASNAIRNAACGGVEPATCRSNDVPCGPGGTTGSVRAASREMRNEMPLPRLPCCIRPYVLDEELEALLASAKVARVHTVQLVRLLILSKAPFLIKEPCNYRIDCTIGLLLEARMPDGEGDIADKSTHAWVVGWTLLVDETCQFHQIAPLPRLPR